MELSLSPKPNPDEDDEDDDDDDLSTQQQQESTSKKRKVVQKTVVAVKIGSKKAPPPDLWSWRKYGQKPIKGSPYPRGYYRCSTTKGCSAKKQVERSKTDGSMFIITYTSSHNHPGPNISTLNLDQNYQDHQIIIQPQPLDQDLVPNQKQNQEEEKPKVIINNHDHFFDELEELPIPPSFSSYFFDEVIRIPAAPS